MSRARDHTTIHLTADDLNQAVDDLQRSWGLPRHQRWITHTPTIEAGLEPDPEQTLERDVVPMRQRLDRRAPAAAVAPLTASQNVQLELQRLHDNLADLQRGIARWRHTSEGAAARQLKRARAAQSGSDDSSASTRPTSPTGSITTGKPRSGEGRSSERREGNMVVVAGAGQIVILNGAPRSGKSSIARALQADASNLWVNLGVDASMRMTPAQFQPGIGLRPGGERPDLEPVVETLYRALYGAVAGHSRLGVDVVVDVGHHDWYSKPLGILHRVATRLAGLPVLFVGVRCPIEVIMQRRHDDRDGYATAKPDGSVPDPVMRWQAAVHDPGLYDLDVDSSMMTPDGCAAVIRDRLKTGESCDALSQAARLSLEASERERTPKR